METLRQQLQPVDMKSVSTAGIAMISGIISQATASHLLVWVSIGVGVSTIAYNVLRFYKEYKSK